MVVNTHCTFGEFKKQHPEILGYYMRAFEDIPGFYKSGDSMYGNCDDMIVRSWDALHYACFVVYLSN